MVGMKVTRIYTGDDGRSHFEELAIPMSESPAAGLMSGVVPTDGIFFREPAGDGPSDFLDFHVAPRRQFVIHMAGRVEIETGSGEKRQFGIGDILLADDTTGQGHISRGIEGPRRQIFVALAESVDLDRWRR
jgi:hypothetical protein